MIRKIIQLSFRIKNLKQKISYFRHMKNMAILTNVFFFIKTTFKLSISCQYVNDWWYRKNLTDKIWENVLWKSSN